MGRTRRSFTTAFKRDAVALVQHQGYSVSQACQTLNIGDTALRRWLAQMETEASGTTPKGQALTPDQHRIQTLEAQVKRLEMEKAILKKRPRSLPRPNRSVYADAAVAGRLSPHSNLSGLGHPSEWLLCVAETPEAPPCAALTASSSAGTSTESAGYGLSDAGSGVGSESVASPSPHAAVSISE